MSRSGYHDDCDDMWASIRWRGAVASAMRKWIQEQIDAHSAQGATGGVS